MAEASTLEIEYDDIAIILNSLGNITALKILEEAYKGFESGNEVIKKFNVTRRKYYRYLKKLSDLDIIDNLGKDYYLTSKGKHFYTLLFQKKTESKMDPLTESFQSIGKKSQIRIIDDYKELVYLMNTLIDQSTSEILLATKYLDLVVIQSLIQAINRDVKLKSITDKQINFANFFQLLSIFIKNIRPNLIKFYRNNYNYKVGYVPFSFLIIDNKYCLFELPSNEFQIAFILTEEDCMKILSNYFWEIWNRSESMKIPDLPRKSSDRSINQSIDVKK